MLNAINSDAQLIKSLYSPKKFNRGNGIAQVKPSNPNTISGTHIQLITLLALFW